MAFLDILRGRKREEAKPKRLPRGALKQADKITKKAKETKTKEKSAARQLPAAKTRAGKSVLAAKILIRPHSTEKTTDLSKQNIYAFRVFPETNKIFVKRAMKEMYGFEPVKIRIVNVSPKKILSRGKIGTRPGFKKVLVYFKKNDKIELV